jgi:hypothetical protein
MQAFAFHRTRMRATRWIAMTMWRHQARQIDPTGKSPKNLSSPRAKNIPLSPSGKSVILIRPSHPTRGALAIVTKRAVGCGGRRRAF